MDLLDTYNKLTVKITELQREATEAAKDALATMAQDYFAKYSNFVSAICWVQLTPYYNDGEECTFRVGDVQVFMKDKEDSEFQYDNEELAYSTYDYSTEKLTQRLALRKEYDVDPLAWSKAKVQENRNKRSYFNYIGSDDYYVDYPPEHATVEELEAALVFAKQLEATDFSKDTDSLINAIQSIDEKVMRTLFGNHVRVIIKQLTDGSVRVLLEEYNHE